MEPNIDTVQAPTPQSSQIKSNNPQIVRIALVGVGMLGIGVLSGYLLFGRNTSSKQAPQAISQIQNNAPLPSVTASQASATTSATAKIYNDIINGISFSYPGDGVLTDKTHEKDYEITVNASKLALVSSVDIQNSRDALIGHPLDESKLADWYDFSFKVYANPQNIPLDSITTDYNGYATNGFKKVNTVMLDHEQGTMGIWTSSDVGSTKDAVFSHNRKIYLFEMIGDNGYYSAAGEKVLDSILSSAHFTK